MEDREFSYINVIPLVDIMLVLLTIVLTTATFMVQGEIPVSLPTAENAKERKSYSTISITLKKDGRLFLQGREVHLTQLREELKAMSGNREINLRVDRDARVELLVKVLDLLNSLGFKDVGMVVRRDGF